jgi:cell division protein FtsZ
MIFGSVINDNLKDEIIVTVIATGFTAKESSIVQTTQKPSTEVMSNRYPKEQHRQPEKIEPRGSIPFYERYSEPEESLDTPAFFRKRKNR